jgi:hypothetical protein
VHAPIRNEKRAARATLRVGLAVFGNQKAAKPAADALFPRYLKRTILVRSCQDVAPFGALSAEPHSQLIIPLCCAFVY